MLPLIQLGAVVVVLAFLPFLVAAILGMLTQLCRKTGKDPSPHLLAQGFLAWDQGDVKMAQDCFEMALEQAEALVSRFTYEDAVAARVDITVHGLRATLGGREVAEWADELLSIAEGGLDRLDVRDAHGRSERVHLVPVRALVDAGACPADFLRSALPEDQPNPHAVVELTRV